MASKTFRELLAAAGLSQAGFARMAGVDARTVNRWKDDAPKWALVIAEQHIELAGLRRKDAVNESLHVNSPTIGRGMGYDFDGAGR